MWPIVTTKNYKWARFGWTTIGLEERTRLAVIYIGLDKSEVDVSSIFISK